MVYVRHIYDVAGHRIGLVGRHPTARRWLPVLTGPLTTDRDEYGPLARTADEAIDWLHHAAERALHNDTI